MSNEVGLTFVERDGQWLLGAERIDETERTLSSIGSARPWAEGPVPSDGRRGHGGGRPQPERSSWPA